MALHIKGRIVYPGGPGSVFHCHLPEAGNRHQPLLHTLAQRRVGDGGLQNPHPHNHHQVGTRIHAQPGRVHLAHALASQPQHTLDGPVHIGRSHALGQTLHHTAHHPAHHAFGHILHPCTRCTGGWFAPARRNCLHGLRLGHHRLGGWCRAGRPRAADNGRRGGCGRFGMNSGDHGDFQKTASVNDRQSGAHRLRPNTRLNGVSVTQDTGASSLFWANPAA